MTTEVKALIDRFDHLRDSGVCSPTTRGLLDDAQKLLTALSTPPADDVREALDADVSVPWPNTMHQVWDRLVEFSGAYRRERGYSPNEAARTRFLFAAFEVRPRGTVTDAEVLRAKAAALNEFADAVRMPFTVFRGDDGEPITPGDLMRETAARYLAEAAKEARS